jgi:hypothetical protein
VAIRKLANYFRVADHPEVGQTSQYKRYSGSIWLAAISEKHRLGFAQTETEETARLSLGLYESLSALVFQKTYRDLSDRFDLLESRAKNQMRTIRLDLHWPNKQLHPLFGSEKLQR